MKFLKNKRKSYFQLLLIHFMSISFLFSCKATSTGPPPGPPPAPQVEEKDSLGGHSIELSDGKFILSNNDYGYSCNLDSCDQAIILYTDDSYGWEWRRGLTGDNDPNYPEVICGTKPWGTQTEDSIFPIRIKDINSFEVEMDIGLGVSGDNWNFAFDFWFTERKPGGTDVSSSITDEAMIWLRWGSTHDGSVDEEDIIVDGENTYDYAHHYSFTNWEYHQFRISGEQRIPPTIDFKLFVDYLQDSCGLSDTLWVSGMELGNEYWDNTVGACTVKTLSYTVNGETVNSGSD
jgi:chitinase